MKRKRHLLDNQINVNLLTKIYFSVIFLLAIKLKSICNLHEHLSSLFWFVATEEVFVVTEEVFVVVSVVTVVVSVVTVVVSVVSLMFLSCLRQVYEVYVLKKVASILATFFSILCFLFVFSLFSEFLFEPLVECHVGTDFFLVLRLGKCQYIAR